MVKINLSPKKLKAKALLEKQSTKRLAIASLAILLVGAGFIKGASLSSSIKLEAEKESVFKNLHKLILDPNAFVVERKSTKQIFGHTYDEAIFRIRGGIAVYTQRIDGVCCTSVPIAGHLDTMPQLSSRPGVLKGEFGTDAPFALLRNGLIGSIESWDDKSAEEKIFGNTKTEGVLPLGK